MGILRRFRLFAALLALVIVSIPLLLQTSAAKAQISHWMEAYAQQKLKLSVNIGRLDYSFFPLSARLQHVTIYNSEHRVAAQADEITAEIPYSFLWVHPHSLKRVDIRNLSFTSGNFSFADLQRLATLEIKIDEIRLRGGQLGDQNLSQIQLESAYQPPLLELKFLTARIGGIFVSAKGKLRFSKEQTDFRKARGNFHLELRSATGKDFRGSLNATLNNGAVTLSDGIANWKSSSAKFSGTAGPESFHLLLDGRIGLLSDFKHFFPSVAGISLRPGRVLSQINGAGTKVRIELSLPERHTHSLISYDRQNGSFQLNGSSSQIAVASLQPLLPSQIADVSGSLSTEFQASGRIQAIDSMHAVIHVFGDLQVRGLQIELRKESTVRIEDNHLETDLKAKSTGGTVEAKATLPLTLRSLQAKITGQTDLAILPMPHKEMHASGPLVFSLDLHGPVHDPRWSARFSAHAYHLRWPNHRLEFTGRYGTGFVNRSGIVFDTAGKLNGSELQAQGSVPLTRSTGNLWIRLTDFSVSSILPANEAHGSIDLNIDATGRGSAISDWNGKLEIKARHLRLQEHTLPEIPLISMELHKGVLHLPHFAFSAPGVLAMQAEAEANLKTGIVIGQAAAGAELSLLRNLTQHIDGQGFVQAELRLKGSLSTPHLSGTMRLKNGFLTNDELPYPLENINMQASMADNEIDLDQFSADLAGGKLSADGSMILKAFSEPELNIHISAQNLTLQYPEDVRSVVNADLNYRGSREPGVYGELDVIALRATRKVDDGLRDLNTYFLEKLKLDPPHKLPNLKLDVRIKSNGTIRIDNNLGHIEAGADVRLRGTPANPDAQGQISISRGELLLQTRIFRIANGVVRFTPEKGLTPVLDLMLASTIQDDLSKKIYRVNFPIRGPIDHPDEAVPTSSPRLLPQQIQFLLLTGRTDAQLSRSASLFMQRELLDYYTVRTVLPVPEIIPRNPALSRPDIRAEEISVHRDPGGRLVNGKEFFRGVNLIYALPLNGITDQTWIGSYPIRRDLAFRLVDQEDGSYTTSISKKLQWEKRSPVSEPSGELSMPRLSKWSISHDLDSAEIPLLSILPLTTGAIYDPVQFATAVDKLKQKLQEAGFLSAEVRVAEKLTADLMVQLQITVRSGGPKKMLFVNQAVEKAQLEKFEAWWREDLPEASVLSLIRQDLLQALWQRGFHRGSVSIRKAQTPEGTTYVFNVSPGAHYRAKILFTGSKPDDNFSQAFESDGQMESEALHDFYSFRSRLESYYGKKCYYLVTVTDAPVAMDPNRASIERRIFLRTGPLLKISQVTFNNSRNIPEELKSSLKLQPGELYNPALLAEDELMIRDFYERQGFHRVQLRSAVKRSNQGVELSYELDKGETAIVQSIRLEGLQRTNATLVRKQLPFSEGDTMVLDKLAAAQKNLDSLNLFSDVRVFPAETAIPDHYTVTIRVVEREKYSANFGGGYNSEKNFEGEFQLSDLNVLGGGQTLSAVGRVNSDDRIYRLIYHTPSTYGLHWKTLISASYEDLEQSAFYTLTKGVQLQRQLEIHSPFVLIANYRLQRVQVWRKDLLQQSVPGEHPVDLSVLSAAVIADTRDDPVSPASGRFLSAEISVAPHFLGSDMSFVKTFWQFYNYRTFGKIVFASGLRLGLARSTADSLIPTERFFAGGAFSLRGFEKGSVGPRDSISGDAVGGEAMFLLNEELRFPLPLHEWLGGAVFYDGGNVFGGVDDFRLLRLRHTIGVGLRFNTPLGIGRLDWGFNLNKKQGERRSVIHLTFGQAF